MLVPPDLYQFMLKFYEEFPDYKKNDFYLSGESYSGHYLPMTGQYFIENDVDNNINFKGIIVGNPYTNIKENNIGKYDTYYGHSMISYPLWESYFNNNCSDETASNSQTCQTIMNEIDTKVGNINTYGVDWSVCNENATTLTDDGPIYDACAQNYLNKYMNRNDVQTALHVKPQLWNACGGVQYNQTSCNDDMTPYWDYLVNCNKPLKLLIYSGDNDSVAGTMGTQYWIWNMNWNVKEHWTNWLISGQNGGYIVKFENISFVTIHSSGHEVPWFKPIKSLIVFDNFLNSDWN